MKLDPRIKLLIPSSETDDADLPDYGTYLAGQGFGAGEVLHLFDLPFHTIDVLSNDQYSTTFWVGSPLPTHAATLDFGQPQFLQLLTALTSSEKASFLASLDGMLMPDRKRLPRMVIARSVQCALGGEQESEDGEGFLPLNIRSLQI